MVGGRRYGFGAKWRRGVGRGDHACLVCDSDEDRWRATLEFTRAGLARGERTLCVARTGGEQEASARLGVLNPVRADQLVVAPAAEAMGYAGGLPFDIPERDAIWREQVRDGDRRRLHRPQRDRRHALADRGST